MGADLWTATGGFRIDPRHGISPPGAARPPLPPQGEAFFAVTRATARRFRGTAAPPHLLSRDRAIAAPALLLGLVYHSRAKRIENQVTGKGVSVGMGRLTAYVQEKTLPDKTPTTEMLR